jgi:hypothetical protein
MRFEILGEISGVETFATGSAIREVARLRRVYGRGRWRKRKVARIRLSDGSVQVAEIHWYEAAGIGREEFRSSTCFEESQNHGETANKTTGGLYRQRRLPSVAREAKIHVALPDSSAEQHGLLRIIDE